MNVQLCRVSGLPEDDLIQPISAWISYDCVSKKGDFGVRWKSFSGEFDLALMQMSFGSHDAEHNVMSDVSGDGGHRPFHPFFRFVVCFLLCHSVGCLSK